MPTNILALPQLGGETISVTTNSDWLDTIQFQWLDGPNKGQPIDLTGIAFRAQLRPDIADQSVLLDMSTANGLLRVNTALGTFGFSVPRDPTPSNTMCMSRLDVKQGILDIVASADGYNLNLHQVSGGALVKIEPGVTRE